MHAAHNKCLASARVYLDSWREMLIYVKECLACVSFFFFFHACAQYLSTIYFDGYSFPAIQLRSSLKACSGTCTVYDSGICMCAHRKVCVCVCERTERCVCVCARAQKGVCVRARAQKGVCVCARRKVCVCVCVCVFVACGGWVHCDHRLHL